MLKKDKGISMIAVLIIIILFIGLIIGVWYFATSLVKAKGLEDLKTDLLKVQAKVKVQAEEYTGKKEENALLGEELPEDILNKLKIEPNEKIKVLTQEDLNQMGLAEIEGDKQYVVDYDNQEVYWTEGYEAKDGNIYYKLSDIQGLTEKISITPKEEENSNTIEELQEETQSEESNTVIQEETQSEEQE